MNTGNLMKVDLVDQVDLVDGKRAALCAWCLRERGEKPRVGDSHGICVRHAREMLAELEEVQSSFAQAATADRGLKTVEVVK